MANKPKAIVFIDETNLHFGFKKHKWDMDYEKFANWLKENYDIVSIYFCKGELSIFGFFAIDLTDTDKYNKFKQFLKVYWKDKNVLKHYSEFKEKIKKYFLYQKLLKKEFNRLRELKINVITKIIDFIPNIKIIDGKEKVEYAKKCNFDVEIATIALDKINDYNEMVLCSGDGDFAYLVRYLKNKGKKITIISHADRLSHHLKEATKYVITLGRLKPIIQLRGSKNKTGST